MEQNRLSFKGWKEIRNWSKRNKEHHESCNKRKGDKKDGPDHSRICLDILLTLFLPKSYAGIDQLFLRIYSMLLMLRMLEKYLHQTRTLGNTLQKTLVYVGWTE